MTDQIPVFLLKVIEKEGELDVIVQSRPPVDFVLRLTKELEYARLGVFEFVLKREGVKGEFGLISELNSIDTKSRWPG
jgi:hypothetical protein